MIKICFLHTQPDIMHNILNLIKTKVTAPDINISVVTNYEYELEFFIRNSDFDILIISSDYVAENRDGIYVAKRVKVINRNALIIFVSTHNQDNLINIANAEPFAYIPVQKLSTELPSALDRAISILNKDTFMYTYFKRNVPYMISLKNVLYFVSSHRIIEYSCIDQKKDSFYEKMDHLEENILKIDHAFLRVSQSYLINTNYILALDNNQIKMINDEIINVSRKYYKNLDVIRKILYNT